MSIGIVNKKGVVVLTRISNYDYNDIKWDTQTSLFGKVWITMC